MSSRQTLTTHQRRKAHELGEHERDAESPSEATDLMRSYQPGQTYLTYDMRDPMRPVIHTLLRKMCVDEDRSDGWGNYGGQTPYGWYWHVLDVMRGEVIVSIDNQYNSSRWKLL